MEEKNSLNSVLAWMRYRLRKAKERDRRSERYFEAASRFLWPWRLSRLVAFAGFVALMDYCSTYAVLEFSGKRYLNEGGPLASWALEEGGFAGLFLADLAAVAAISITAIVARFMFRKFKFDGFGRAAFVFLLIPYVVMALVAVVNNMILAYL